MPKDRLPKLNRRGRNKSVVAKGTIYSFYIGKFTVLLKALEIFSLLRLSVYPDPPKGMNISLSVYSQLLLRVVGTLEYVTEQCFSPKPRASFKKNKSQWAESGVDPETFLFPLLDAAARQKRDAAETDLGPLKTISKVAYSFLCLPPKDLRQKRNFEGPDPYFPVCTQRQHIIASYRQILIYVHIFLGFSSPEGTPPFLLYPSSLLQNKPQHEGQLFSQFGEHLGWSEGLGTELSTH